MCFVLQIINFHSHNTSLKKKNNKAYLKFLLAEFHTFIFYNAAVSKNILSWTKYHSFVILKLKKQGDVLEQDI
jgi:hypothetical protein